MKYYAYMIMVRANESNHLHKTRGLFQQFLVDMYAKIETERMDYIRNNQPLLRADTYEHLRDAINNDKDLNDIGKVVHLPGSYTGGDAYMRRKILDGLTYVIHHGPPDLFITVTCNPNWDEIKRELFPGQTAKDRPDLVARVFKMKVKKVMDILQNHNVFGYRQCYMFTIEWQKRGLPHVHILLWLKEKIHPSEIDSVISAEIPDPTLDPELYKLVTSHMIHGPECNCTKTVTFQNGRRVTQCVKKYPREFLKETKTDHDGYPLYRRRRPQDGGHVALIDRKKLMTVKIQRKCENPFRLIIEMLFLTIHYFCVLLMPMSMLKAAAVLRP